ncbi:hypothetical protein AKUH3B111A_00860 [Apilactobacillus kunkeei]|nr:hypothetical protein AKUH3B104X_00860 [Apilactobacillus kunkeei]CAI2553001.1 hypothetical protein AKUH3B111A_00860 [Apilactobacillus kunkeei]CAI2553047.1 hypothetical protein AKUH3B103M_00860 [Apilactobacillus kunkeei]CAI2553380.1 hypothetical protein AKUH1B302M_00860 [Apilactobacillus kunkeei]CAI2609304.1 hypothetical protein AKUH3B202X_00790 [Apilactobacillus kunkeei]
MNVPLFVLLDIAEMSSSSYYDACQREYEVDDQKVISEIKVIRNKFKDYNSLNQAVKEYISYYNNYRIKQKLGGMSPVEYRINSSQKIA